MPAGTDARRNERRHGTRSDVSGPTASLTGVRLLGPGYFGKLRRLSHVGCHQQPKQQSFLFRGQIRGKRLNGQYHDVLFLKRYWLFADDKILQCVRGDGRTAGAQTFDNLGCNFWSNKTVLLWRCCRLSPARAKLSGGAYFDFPDIMKAVEKVQGITHTNERPAKADNLWDEWWVVVLIVSLLAIEWILRKAVRLV